MFRNQGFRTEFRKPCWHFLVPILVKKTLTVIPWCIALFLSFYVILGEPQIYTVFTPYRIALRCVASRLENVSDRPFVYTWKRPIRYVFIPGSFQDATLRKVIRFISDSFSQRYPVWCKRFHNATQRDTPIRMFSLWEIYKYIYIFECWETPFERNFLKAIRYGINAHDCSNVV